MQTQSQHQSKHQLKLRSETNRNLTRVNSKLIEIRRPVWNKLKAAAKDIKNRSKSRKNSKAAQSPKKATTKEVKHITATSPASHALYIGIQFSRYTLPVKYEVYEASNIDEVLKS